MDDLLGPLRYYLTFHNPRLIKHNAAPEKNIVYKVWSDGEITYEKGGTAYGHRSAHTAEIALLSNERTTKLGLDFPMKFEKAGCTMSYAIVTPDIAETIRCLLVMIFMRYLNSYCEWDPVNLVFTSVTKVDHYRDWTLAQWIDQMSNQEQYRGYDCQEPYLYPQEYEAFDQSESTYSEEQ